jgi:hypothetical protein
MGTRNSSAYIYYTAIATPNAHENITGNKSAKTPRETAPNTALHPTNTNK